MKNKVLFIISDHNFGGGSRHLYDLIGGLDKRKFEPILISIPAPILDRLKDKIKTYPVEMKSRLDFQAIKKIRQIIKLEKPAIIHLHSTRAGIIGTLAAKNLKVPIIYTEHLYTQEYKPINKIIHFGQIFAYKKLSKYITKVIAVSEASKKYLVNAHIFPKNKIEVIHHGIQQASNVKRQTSKEIIVGSVGTLTEIKGYEYLIKAIQDIKNVKLEIMGTGPDLEKLKKLDINKKVKFWGFVNRPEKNMSRWSIYIQPSLAESFGLALAEAMSLGLPVIASKVGGISELVDSAGILVPAESTKVIRDAIIELIENPQLGEKLGRHARTRIQEKFSVQNMVYKVEKLYEKILAKRP